MYLSTIFKQQAARCTHHLALAGVVCCAGGGLDELVTSVQSRWLKNYTVFEIGFRSGRGP